MLLIVIMVVVLGFYVLGQFIFRSKWSSELDITADFNAECYARGDIGTFTETISNGKWMPIPLLVLSFGLHKSMKFQDMQNVVVSDKSYRSDVFSMMSNQREIRRFDILFTERGMFYTGELSILVTDLFGRNRYGANTDSGDIIYVYPARVHSIELDAVLTKLIGEYYNRKFIYEDPFEFKGMRDYAPTDPMKKINWKAYAKTGELKVNQYYDTRGLSVTIYLNLEPDGLITRSYLIEAAIEITRTLFEDFLKQGIPVRLITNAVDMINGTEISVCEGAGIGHLETCLKQLARIDASKYSVALEEVFEREKDNEEGMLPILVSLCQRAPLVAAYESFLGNNIGEMLVPVAHMTDGRVTSNRIHVNYMEVEKK